MFGPNSIDPDKLDEARAAYQADLAQSRPELIDGNGKSRAQDPFNANPDGTVSFNRWTDSGNQSGSQNTFFDDAGSGGKTVRRASWQAVPTFYNNQGRDQFSNISDQLNSLQTSGFANMQSIYKRALSGIR